MCATIHQSHIDHSSLVFLFFDDSYKQIRPQKAEQLREIEFEDSSYQEIAAAFNNRSIKPAIIVFRFQPGQPTLFLPQELPLTNSSKEEIEIRSMPLLLYDEMLPVL